jgi:hypothetical protein
VPISFTVPLASSLTAAGCYIETAAGPIQGPCQIHYVKPNGKELVFSHESFERVEFPSSACTGTVDEPTASPGNVCIYEGILSSAEVGAFFGGAFTNSPSGALAEFSRAGGIVVFNTLGSSGSGSGTWAVTG